MKILFKKWDFWYWLVFIFIVYFYSLIQDTYFHGTTPNSFTYIVLSISLFIPSIFIYIFFKVVEKLIEKIKTQENKTNYKILLVVVILCSMVIGWQVYKML